MKYFIFKAPLNTKDTPLEELNYEPNDFIIQQKAMKYGAIVVCSEEDLKLQKENKV